MDVELDGIVGKGDIVPNLHEAIYRNTEEYKHDKAEEEDSPEPVAGIGRVHAGIYECPDEQQNHQRGQKRYRLREKTSLINLFHNVMRALQSYALSTIIKRRGRLLA